MHDRLPPQNLDAERSILASMFELTEVQDDAFDALQPADFYSPAHREIFEAMVSASSRGDAIDPVTVAHELRRNARAAGEAALPEVMDAPTSPRIGPWARIVFGASRLRQTAEVGRRAAEAASVPDADADDVLDRVESDLMRIRDGRGDTSPEAIGYILRRTFDAIEITQKTGQVAGIPTGFNDLDRMTTGMHRGDLWVIAARPGMGKTAFALAVGIKAALRSDPVRIAIFSLEMSKAQLGERSLSAQAGVEMRRLRSGKLSRNEMSRLGLYGPQLVDIPIYVDDTPGLNIMQLRAKARRVKSKHGLDLVMVDYLQLMETVERGRSREREVAEMSRGLKNLAKELDITVLALSQLSREVERRPNKRPVLSDLRESGAIEQDADTVLFIYRDEVYKADTKDRGVAEIIVGKQRNGPTGVVKLAFEKEYTRFGNLAMVESCEGNSGRDGFDASDWED